jgi:hypothetical protein
MGGAAGGAYAGEGYDGPAMWAGGDDGRVGSPRPGLALAITRSALGSALGYVGGAKSSETAVGASSAKLAAAAGRAGGGAGGGGRVGATARGGGAAGARGSARRGAIGVGSGGGGGRAWPARAARRSDNTVGLLGSRFCACWRTGVARS